MTATLAIHAEISTFDDLKDVIVLFLRKSADNPYDLERMHAFLSGMAEQFAKQPDPQPLAQAKKE